MEFATLGGKLLFYDYDEKNEGLKNFVDSKIILDIDSELIKSVQGLLNIDFKILEGNRDEIYYNHRIIEDKDFYLVANGADKKKEIKIRFRALGCPKKYNIETGKNCLLENYQVVDEQHTDVYFTLNEDEAVYVSFDKQENNKELTGTFNDDNIEILNLDGAWNMIPLPAKYDKEWGTYEKETEMEIPIADFTSDVTVTVDVPIAVNGTNEVTSPFAFLRTV